METRAHTELFFVFWGGNNLYVDYFIRLSLQTHKAGTIVISIWQTKALKLRELKNLLQVIQLINMYLVVVLVIKWYNVYEAISTYLKRNNEPLMIRLKNCQNLENIIWDTDFLMWNGWLIYKMFLIWVVIDLLLPQMMILWHLCFL